MTAKSLISGFLGVVLSLFAVLTPSPATAGGGWSGQERGSIDRATPETHVWTVLASASGTTADVIDMDTITTADWETGDTIAAGSITPPDGVRTLCFRYVEASGTDGRLTVRITGQDHFGRNVQSTLAFTSSGVLVTDAAFAPYPEPVVYVVLATALNASDSIYCNSYGQGLYANPQTANDLREFRVNGTQKTYTTATNFATTSGSSTPSASVSYFTTGWSTWNPDTGNLPTAIQGQVVNVIPNFSQRVWDAFATDLPGTALTDDLGLVTLGTTVATNWDVAVQTANMDNNDAVVPYYAATQFTLPPSYVSGGAVTLTSNAGMVTTVADVSCTIDFEVFEYGTPATDLCATAAQDINSLTAGNDTFTITATNLVAGDTIIIRTTIAGRDDTATGSTIGRMNKLSISSLQNSNLSSATSPGLSIIQLTPNTTSYRKDTVVFGDGVGGTLLKESKSE